MKRKPGDDSEDDLLENDDDEEMEQGWGKKKSTYWSGDTADLEIGQDVEDAEEEEEAAKVENHILFFILIHQIFLALKFLKLTRLTSKINLTKRNCIKKKLNEWKKKILKMVLKMKVHLKKIKMVVIPTARMRKKQKLPRDPKMPKLLANLNLPLKTR